MYMPTYTYQIEGGLEHTWHVDNVIETANSKNELVFKTKHKRKQRCILEMMRLLLNETKRNDIKIFAISGTLLGAKRNHGIIPYDDDGDFGFTMTEYDKLLELTKTLSHPKYIFKEALDCGFRMENKYSYVSHLDLFAMGIDQDPTKIVHVAPIIDKKPVLYTQYLFPRDWMDYDCIKTLEWCYFEDFKVPCPTNAEKQLVHIYSPTCLTTYVPDKRNILGVDTHDILHFIEPIGLNIIEVCTRFNQHLPYLLQPRDRRGYLTVALILIFMETAKINLDQSDSARSERIKQILSEYLQYKGILL